MGEHVVGHLLDPAPGVGAYQAGGSPASHLLHHVVSAPGGRGSDQLGQALAHDGPPVGAPCIKLLLEYPPVDDVDADTFAYRDDLAEAVGNRRNELGGGCRHHPTRPRRQPDRGGAGGGHGWRGVPVARGDQLGSRVGRG